MRSTKGHLLLVSFRQAPTGLPLLPLGMYRAAISKSPSMGWDGIQQVASCFKRNSLRYKVMI